MMTFSHLRSYAGAVTCSLLLAVGASAHAADPVAPRDAELRATVISLRTASFDEAARNATTTYLEQLSRRFPADPYVSVQLANVYSLQARYASGREAKAVWAAKADGVLDEVIAAHPGYLLAQSTRGVHMVMAPPVMGLEAHGERQLKQIIASTAPRLSDDDDEAVIISHVFLSRLYDRQAEALSGDAQAAKRRDAEQVRSDLKKRYPRFDMARSKSAN